MSNRSLDEFADAEPAEPASDDPAADAEPASEPLDSTYAWRPEGAPCAVCGAVVDERWRAAEGLVCADCKEW